MEISPVTLVLIGLCSGIGNAAGTWFFNEYLKHRAVDLIEHRKIELTTKK